MNFLVNKQKNVPWAGIIYKYLFVIPGSLMVIKKK